MAKSIADRWNAIVEANDDGFDGFRHVENKRSQRPLLHALLLLEELFPKETTLFGRAANGELWLGLGYKKIAKLTDAQILELIRCGIAYDRNRCVLYVFV